MSLAIATNLKRLRKTRGLSQQELANKMGLRSHSSIVQWESGQPISAETVERYAAALECDTSDIDQHGEAFTVGKRRPRGAGKKALKKSRPAADSPSIVLPDEEAALMNGGLPMADQDLLSKLLGAWRLLEDRHAHEAFVDHVLHDYLGLPRARARRKHTER